jgi:Uma2 family endonuclease
MDDATIFAMAKGATLDDLRRVEGKAELVGGEIVRMTPAGIRHAYASAEIVASLREYAKRTGHGFALGDNAGFRVNLPHRQSFSPDAAFYIGPMTEDFAPGPPAFAVEIRSRDNSGASAEARMAAKRADYFTSGTLVIWDVDLAEGLVHVYRATHPDVPYTYVRGETAEAEPGVPGWSMPVSDLCPR